MRWTAEEDALVRELWGAHGRSWAGWADVLPRHSACAISERAHLLGCVSHARHAPVRLAWTRDEDERVRALWPTYGERWEGWARAVPRHSTSAIRMRASRLGCTGTRPEWTREEDAVLACDWPGHGAGWEMWRHVLPGHDDVCRRAWALGLMTGDEELAWRSADDGVRLGEGCDVRVPEDAIG